ncbi:hypothetical protein GMOD_00003824 [Pyrenophora seminiperda CCB06]|uniref:Uncharacterized protein n=1 Tax=Pyrenophora seminiperda CCB06 TaxID=1302712 RepID=A0A3M7LZU9_9PLEO|nr:hypothetical protein GMOD_00003824 [Pyrenophora seminiperda CCB06]
MASEQHEGITRDSNTLAAPSTNGKGPDSSTVSIASSDAGEDMSKDGATVRLKTRKHSDARSDASSSHRQRMSKLFKGRKKSRASVSQDDLSMADPADHIPPVPDLKRPSMGQLYQSDDSLGLAKSVTSSLLTEDSDVES